LCFWETVNSRLFMKQFLKRTNNNVQKSKCNKKAVSGI
jgi:hypothetical protein